MPQLSATVKFSRIAHDRAVQVDVGMGQNRQHLSFASDEPQKFYGWLLSLATPGQVSEFIQSARQVLDISEDEAQDLVEQLCSAGILGDGTAPLDNLILKWAQYGWRDAADFHVSQYGLPFLPDNDGGALYKEIYSNLLENPGPVGSQPEHYSPKSTTEAVSFAIQQLSDDVTVQSTLQNSMPINKFTGPRPDIITAVAGLTDAVGSQRVVAGSLGPFQQRSYPSGGARHPMEAYLVSKPRSTDELGLSVGGCRCGVLGCVGVAVRLASLPGCSGLIVVPVSAGAVR